MQFLSRVRPYHYRETLCNIYIYIYKYKKVIHYIPSKNVSVQLAMGLYKLALCCTRWEWKPVQRRVSIVECFSSTSLFRVNNCMLINLITINCKNRVQWCLSRGSRITFILYSWGQVVQIEEKFPRVFSFFFWKEERKKTHSHWISDFFFRK